MSEAKKLYFKYAPMLIKQMESLKMNSCSQCRKPTLMLQGAQLCFICLKKAKGEKDMKKITSIQTWAGMSVALCDDGTIWEARPEFNMEDPSIPPRLSKMNWSRVADVGDVQQCAVGAQASPESLFNMGLGPKPAPDPIRPAGMHPFDADIEILKKREAEKQAAYLREVKERMIEPFEKDAPDWYRLIEGRTCRYPTAPEDADWNTTRQAFADRSMLMKNFRETICALYCIIEHNNSGANIRMYVENFLRECLGFKKV